MGSLHSQSFKCPIRFIHEIGKPTKYRKWPVSHVPGGTGQPIDIKSDQTHFCFTNAQLSHLLTVKISRQLYVSLMRYWCQKKIKKMSFFLTTLASVQMEYLNHGTIFSWMACVEIFRTLFSTISPQIMKIWRSSIELAELWSTWACWLRWKSMHVDHYLFWKINSAYQAPFYCVIYRKMQFFTGYLLVLLFFWGRIEVIQFWGKNPKKLQKNWFFFCCFLVKRTTLGRPYTWESWSMTMNLIDLIKIH